MFEGPDGYAAAAEAFAAAVAPKRVLSHSEWADAERMLAPGTGPEPGRWRNSRTPYGRAIMDALSPRHPAWLVVLCKSSQVAGSEFGVNWIGSTIAQKPVSFLVLTPSDKVSRRWMRTKFDPM